MVKQSLAVFSRYKPLCFYRRLKVIIKLIGMCLAIPAKVLSINGNKANVDFGKGVVKDVNISLVDAKVGDYVIIHAGYALEVLDEEDALESIRLWNSLLVSQKE